MNPHLFSIQLAPLFYLVIAHFLADFVFQTQRMVKNKAWFSDMMVLHMASLGILTFLFSAFNWKITLLVVVSHWVIDGTKISLQKKYPGQETFWFIGDQFLHLSSIFYLWIWNTGFSLIDLQHILPWFGSDRQVLIALGYTFLIWPAGYLVRFALKDIAPNTHFQPPDAIAQPGDGGKRIGQLERVLLFTLVLADQLGAIGFLMAGKGLIRFADKNEEQLRSEYILIGTLLSFLLSVGTGLLVKQVLLFL